jgi:hypothetical protein
MYRIQIGRAIRSTWNDMEKDIDKLTATMRDMKRSFEGDLTVQCVFLSAKVLNVVERLGAYIYC